MVPSENPPIISIAVLHEIITGQVGVNRDIDVEYTTSANMAADMVTKCFTDNNKWSAALRAISIVDRAALAIKHP